MITQPTDIANICQLYSSGTPCSQIARIYNCAQQTVKSVLLKNGVKIRTCLESRKRKYSFDVNFFKKIVNENQAYWLGFLYADGCITQYSVNLLIHQNDKDHLLKFKNDINFTGPIEYRNDKIDYGEKYGIKISHTAKIRIASKTLRDDLINLGCVPRKTFVLKFPSEEMLPKDLICHFIRGYFDGDGTVYIRKYQRKDKRIRGYAQIIGTLDIMSKIKSICIERLGLKENEIPIYSHPTSKGIFRIQFCSFKSMKRFRTFLYSPSNIFLSRKKELFYKLDLEN